MKLRYSLMTLALSLVGATAFAATPAPSIAPVAKTTAAKPAHATKCAEHQKQDKQGRCEDAKAAAKKS
ncbi:hypothetical protein [Pseudoxanthomonas japonensis]|uniref:hypothetical protein n=1 Tax=Pseudoxanthomonas japonensis TaxID=69284 RepID=UPI000DB2EE17|nr:hypothetical protein [Pseudoxanthomonas japonensis]PZQ26500.1 MAG: hypothetical protein DI562_14810 [Stenotrophomonas acidaminiphila]